MSVRLHFLASLVLAVIAVCIHMAALGQIGRGVGLRARAVSAAASERASMKAEASRYSRSGSVIGYTGLVVALVSVGFVIVSARRHEPARRSLTYTMLFVYVMLQFVLV